ncbi:MAG TPA: hypothetical protein VLE02_01550 [Nitrosarchaeum sp.]|nr:hypothetical protein [Nitrosarchaeum sp.]
MSYIPGGGIKKPLNQLENPVYPAIQKAVPRFRWTKKHWTVGSEVLKNTEHLTQFYENAVLAQPRDYNKTIYGQSSHRDIVNANFRPPLIDPITDIYPLSRIPVKIETIIPNINPGTANFDIGSSAYASKNEYINNTDKAMTDRIKSGESRPSFFFPLDLPEDNSRLPDLDYNIPQISANSGYSGISIDAPIKEVELNHTGYSIPMDSGSQYETLLTPSSGLEDVQLEYTRPQVSASSGMNTPIYTMVSVGNENLELGYNRPMISACSGYTTNFTNDDLNMNTDKYITNKRSDVMMNTVPSYENFTTKLDEPQNIKKYIKKKIETSYYVPPNSTYKHENNLHSNQPHFKEKLQPVKMAVSAGGTVKRYSHQNLRYDPNRYNGAIRTPNHKKVQYRF